MHLSSFGELSTILLTFIIYNLSLSSLFCLFLMAVLHKLYGIYNDSQFQRAKQWADRMDEMGMERLRIASELMETLDTIEQQSGIFLIKPMYSYRGR